jgi:hypothetical protein
MLFECYQLLDAGTWICGVDGRPDNKCYDAPSDVNLTGRSMFRFGSRLPALIIIFATSAICAALTVGFAERTIGALGTNYPNYKGVPYEGSRYKGGPQRVPGRVECAYYDLGGEGVAYHDNDSKNHGSGELNPADGTYLNEFRMDEGVDISYTKFHDQIDNNPFNLVQPPENQLYVGWTEPGEWFNTTVEVARAGVYSANLLYTSNRGGTISMDVNGKDATGPVKIISTFSAADPIAWRQWHHWNIMRDIVRLRLPAGKNVLTVHILTEGNMNLAYFDFRKARERKR